MYYFKTMGVGDAFLGIQNLLVSNNIKFSKLIQGRFTRFEDMGENVALVLSRVMGLIKCSRPLRVGSTLSEDHNFCPLILLRCFLEKIEQIEQTLMFKDLKTFSGKISMISESLICLEAGHI